MYLSLRQKIFALITGMGLITVASAGAVLWSTMHIDQAANSIVEQEILARTESLRIFLVFAVSCFILLSGFLALILYRQILDPIRQLAQEAGGSSPENQRNEVQFLRSSLYRFLEDFDFAHNELTKSREHLEQAEKMALVGKLAAGVTHTIRNPFTSIKMRLYSLSRSLHLSENDKEDFDVISEEISRIDNIVQNFLEFARPPKLRMQACRIQDVIDSALQLLKYRLQSHNVQVYIQETKEPPLVWADPEQLKEALINLIINAYESMSNGGWIQISLKTREEASSQQAVIWVQDNGEGIHSAIQNRVMQPFFTTKEEGTGLGLSIVNRIVEEHGGAMQFVSRPGQGTTFEIALPAKEESDEQNFDH
jgi:signal transduction histidine kinase